MIETGLLLITMVSKPLLFPGKIPLLVESQASLSTSVSTVLIASDKYS